MKKILCFGDSNVYGFNPKNFQRYEENKRWSGILKNALDGYIITEAGCNNRTCFSNKEKNLNSFEAIDKYLLDNYDIVILAIGINDLQYKFNTDTKELEEKLIKLIGKINSNVILLCPNKIDECILNSYFSELFNKTSVEKSKNLREIYSAVAKQTNSKIIYLEDIAKTSTIDGLHYMPEEHEKIANALIKFINNNF